MKLTAAEWATLSLVAVSLVVGLCLWFGLSEVDDDEPSS
jgi:hypothetical protein